MLVNEAPWLTGKIEIAATFALFLVCLLADLSKCKTGYFASCIGGEISLCDKDIEQEPCDDTITPSPFIEQRSRCDCTSHNSSIFFHVVQVGPPVNRATKRRTALSPPIAQYISQSLLKRLGNVMHANNTKGFLDTSYFLHMRRRLELEIYDDTPLSARCSMFPLTRFRLSYSYDTFNFFEHSQLITDLSFALPFKNDYLSIRRFFPQLYQTFERLAAAKRGHGFKKKNPCSLTHLVLVIAFLPGVKTAWAHENARDAGNVLIEVHRRIRRVISLYIRKKPRYARLLSSVSFVNVPIGYPARTVQESGDKQRLATSFCASLREEPKRKCIVNCAQYEQFLPEYLKANEQLQHLLEPTGARRPQENAVLLPYNDYFGKGLVNRSQWEDCLTLSRQGARTLSESIVKGLFF